MTEEKYVRKNMNKTDPETVVLHCALCGSQVETVNLPKQVLLEKRSGTTMMLYCISCRIRMDQWIRGMKEDRKGG